MLHGGVHFLGLNGTLELTSSDSGTHFIGAPGEDVWLSGGVPISSEAVWDKVSHPSTGGKQIWKTTLPVDGHSLPTGLPIRNLYTVDSHERLTWARYPNMDVENDMWGYNSPVKFNLSIPSSYVAVLLFLQLQSAP